MLQRVLQGSGQRYSFDSLRRLTYDARVVQVDRRRLMEITSDFYSKLYTADPVTEEIASAREEIWSHIPPMVTDRMSHMIDCPLILMEIYQIFGFSDWY